MYSAVSKWTHQRDSPQKEDWNTLGLNELRLKAYWPIWRIQVSWEICCFHSEIHMIEFKYEFVKQKSSWQSNWLPRLHRRSVLDAGATADRWSKYRLHPFSQKTSDKHYEQHRCFEKTKTVTHISSLIQIIIQTRETITWWVAADLLLAVTAPSL